MAIINVLLTASLYSLPQHFSLTAVHFQNDDGPPNPRESPYVLGLYNQLVKQLGWNVKVVLPSAQKSWIGPSLHMLPVLPRFSNSGAPPGKAYHIKETTKGWYFYPREDGQGETSTKSRPLKDNELAEWILLDGTPATCANVALHNLYPGQIDLVISGPNLGRNSSAAFALSSGTIGAALSSSLSKMRSIALSYGTVTHPTPTDLFEPAHALGCRIIQHLWHNWGEDKGGLRTGEIDLYNINIPMIEGLLSEEGLKIYWTSMWRNSYGRLFKNISQPETSDPRSSMRAAGPDALDEGSNSAATQNPTRDESGDLLFKFAPDITGLITPALSILPVGSDGWAIHHGWVSVTPLRACYAEPLVPIGENLEDRLWKL
ncbi:hypothetical protein AX17_000633 [Amanita inopinata Kibby_2008]|nr:hypothetical protein AX17_000633 [Amanita inopinata Kibby_2008]